MRYVIAGLFWILSAGASVAGVILIFRGFAVMAEGDLPQELATYVLLKIILGFCFLALGYWAAGKGKARINAPA